MKKLYFRQQTTNYSHYLFKITERYLLISVWIYSTLLHFNSFRRVVIRHDKLCLVKAVSIPFFDFFFAAFDVVAIFAIRFLCCWLAFNRLCKLTHFYLDIIWSFKTALLKKDSDTSTSIDMIASFSIDSAKYKYSERTIEVLQRIVYIGWVHGITNHIAESR